jgi:cystathionine beta-lyase/cystathionine gamma-synthase
VAEIAHAGGANLVVDNVFATPLLQSPFEMGADCVVYSTTKHIDGQGRCLGGVILASNEFIQTHVHNFLRQTGPALSPFNAWVMLKGLETLPVRLMQQQRNAVAVADYLVSLDGWISNHLSRVGREIIRANAGEQGCVCFAHHDYRAGQFLHLGMAAMRDRCVRDCSK